MPIITPAYPSMCATFNITHSSKAVIQKELDFFAEQVEQIMLGKLPWKSLFVKHTFFTQDYKYYIIVNAASMTKENSKIWGGFVESKIRLLVQSLERHASIQLARPFNKGYERKHRCSHNYDEWPKILDGSLEYRVKDEDSADEVKTESATDIVKAEPDSKAEVENGIDEKDDQNVDGKMETEDDKADKYVYTSTHYIGIELRPGKFMFSFFPTSACSKSHGHFAIRCVYRPPPTARMILNARTNDKTGAKQLDLSYEVNDFKNLCFNWDKYNEELSDSCAVSIQHVRK